MLVRLPPLLAMQQNTQIVAKKAALNIITWLKQTNHVLFLRLTQILTPTG